MQDSIARQTTKAAIAADVAGDEQTLLNQIINTTMQTLHAEVCSIFLEDKEREPGILKCVAGSGFAGKIVGIASYNIGEGFTGSVAQFGGEYNIKSRQELHDLEIHGKKVWKGEFDYAQWSSGGDEFRNLIALPLKIKDQTLGVIKAENKIESYGVFTDDDLLIFKTVANVISLALENKRLHVKAEEQSKRVSAALADIVGAVVGRYDMKALLDQITNTMVRILHAEACSIFLEDKEQEPGLLKCVAGSGFASKIIDVAQYQIGEGFTGSMAQFGGEYNIKSREQLENLEIDGKRVWKGEFDHIQWPSRKSEFRNLLVSTLRIKGQTLGVIKVENKIDGDYFTSEDETIFKIIANVIALTIEKTKLQFRIENQLKTISAMAGHRISNLLTRYDGIIWDLKDLYKVETITKENLASIEVDLNDATTNIKRLVSEFRKYGRPIELRKTPSNINEILQNEIWHASPADNIKIIQELSPGLPDLGVDGSRFPESIKELLGNAIRVTNESKGTGNIWGGV